MIAVWVKSGLTIPDQGSRIISLYLLIAIGFHGGVELAASGPIILLLGSLFIGGATGANGWETLEPVFGAPFKGILVLFLL